MEIQKLINNVETEVAKDFDVCEYASTMARTMKKFLKHAKIIEGEMTSETATALYTIATFYDIDNVPGGSRADYLSSAVVKAFEGYNLVSIDAQAMNRLAKNIGENAIQPKMMMETIEKFS